MRVGRVWLEIRIAPSAAQSASAAAAKELALELVSRGLAAQGEDGRPRVFVLEGPDEGKEIRLGEVGRPYVVGRSKECDLMLLDPHASRRHLEMACKGDHLVIRELAQKGETALEGSPLGPGDTPWRPGQVLALGQDVLIFDYPAAEILAELEQSRDEVMKPGDAVPEPARPDEQPVKPPAEEPAPIAKAPERLPAQAQPADGTWSLTDAAVVLLALGVLAISMVGLWWFLKR
jgi:pSer/pThr/pTyr-binding forkhead associated (FHA) protein